MNALFPDGVPAQLLVSVGVILVVINVVLVTIALLIYFERKISAYIQDRIGPNRTGFDFGLRPLRFLRGAWGFGQSLADGVKLYMKEDFTPGRVDKVLFTIAPMAIIIPALMTFAIIPWGGSWNVGDFTFLGVQFRGGEVTVAGAAINIGIIYVLAVTSIGVYGVTLGGWASNNKYSFLGGLRATAQMISYEVPMGLSILAALLLIGTLVPESIVAYQREHAWLVFSQPLAALLLFVAMLAEANRAPFDNAEAEQELVGGYHTEYSSMRFGLFLLAEYGHVFVGGAFFTLLFLGGWDPLPFGHLLPDEAAPGLAGFGLVVLKFVIYYFKALLFSCFVMVVRWTLPRVRYDQIMMLGWQALIPMSLAVVVMTSVMTYLGDTTALGDLRSWPWMLAANAALLLVMVMVVPLLPRSTRNRRVPLYGSRFSPVPGEIVLTAPTDPDALHDHPSATAIGV